MIFLDTCVWIELFGVQVPQKPHEIRQAQAASALLQKVLEEKEIIVTCKEQMLELISAIEKVTMRTVNRNRKANRQPGVSNLKEFRMLQEFQQTKELCKSVIDDVSHFAEINDIGEYDVNSLLQRLELADINDCLYYDYCIEKNIRFYTFDSDMARLGDDEVLHRFDAQADAWN